MVKTLANKFYFDFFIIYNENVKINKINKIDL